MMEPGGMVGEDARVALGELGIAGRCTEAPCVGFTVAARTAEDAGEAGRVLRVAAGAGQGVQPVDSGLAGAQSRRPSSAAAAASAT